MTTTTPDDLGGFAPTYGVALLCAQGDGSCHRNILEPDGRTLFGVAPAQAASYRIDGDAYRVIKASKLATEQANGTGKRNRQRNKH